MQSRIDPGSGNIGINREVVRGIKQRVWPPAFEPPDTKEVLERRKLRICDIRIALAVELFIEEA